jgi:integrase
VAQDRERKPSTLKDYRSIVHGRLVPAFGAMPLDDVTPGVVEEWRLSLGGLSNRSKNKLLIVLHGLRMGELLALRWRAVVFAGSVIRVRGSFAAGQLTTPKSGKVRPVLCGRA